MSRLKLLLKKLIFPITLMSIVALAGIILSLQALYISFTHDHTAAIYAAVIVPLTMLALLFYAVDRFLIKKIPYWKLVVLELITLAVLYWIFIRN